MPSATDSTAIFEGQRQRLFGVAYRMLGSVEDAEDIVQESYLRWQQARLDHVRSPEGWLISVVTRLAIDRLRRAATERAAYTGPWLPEPIATADWAAPDHRAELQSDLSLSFLVLLERLAPEERAAFLMHDVLDCGYAEIAEVLEKNEAACRQLVHRARTRVRRDHARFTAAPDALNHLLEQFLAAIERGDRDALLAVFAEDATWTADGGGKVAATRNVLTGPDRIVRFLLGVARKYPGVLTHRVESINNEPAIVTYANGQVFAVTAFASDGEHIFAGYRVMNPDKLRRVKLHAE